MHFWPMFGFPTKAAAGYAWVKAPPFMVVDLLLGLQPYTNGEEHRIEAPVLSDTATLRNPDSTTCSRRIEIDALKKHLGRRQLDSNDIRSVRPGTPRNMATLGGVWRYRRRRGYRFAKSPAGSPRPRQPDAPGGIRPVSSARTRSDASTLAAVSRGRYGGPDRTSGRDDRVPARQRRAHRGDRSSRVSASSTQIRPAAQGRRASNSRGVFLPPIPRTGGDRTMQGEAQVNQ